MRSEALRVAVCALFAFVAGVDFALAFERRPVYLVPGLGFAFLSLVHGMALVFDRENARR